MRKYSRINLKEILALVAFVASSLFAGYVSFNTNETYAFPLLATVWFYVGWLFMDKNVFAFFSRPTVFLFVSINAVRYIALPIMILIGTLSSSSQSVSLPGCILYLYEEVAVCLFMSFVLKKLYQKELPLQNIVKKETSYLLYALVIALGIIAIIMSPGILDAYNFIFASKGLYSSFRMHTILDGLWGIIYRIAFLLFPCMFSFAFYRLYTKTKSKIFAILFTVALLITTLGFCEGSSRNSAIIPAMAALFLLIRCFPKKKKTILISVGTIIVIGFWVMTMTKLSFINSYSGRAMPTTLKAITSMIEAYFSGPSNFSTSVEAKANFQSMFTFHTWFNDVFGNWPVLSSYADQSNRTTSFYNMTYYGRSLVSDQIIPTTGQGIFHFGYIFSVIPICLFLYVSALFDNKANRTNDYIQIYIYSYVAVRFAMALIANISIMSAFIGTPLIEILLIIYASKLPKPSLASQKDSSSII